MPGLGPASSGVGFYVPPELFADGTGPLPAIDASVTRTDGADSAGGTIDPLVDASVTRVDGADSSAGSVDVVVAASVARTDGADGLASSAAPLVDVGVARVDGADASAAAVDAVVSASVARTDGADSLAAAADPVVALTVARTDGEDVSAALVSPDLGSIDASVDASEGADTVVALISLPSDDVVYSGGFLPPRRRKTKKRIQEERERLGIVPAPDPALSLETEIEPAPLIEAVAEPVYVELSETKTPAKPTLTQLLAVERGLRQLNESQLRALDEQDEEDLLALL